MGFEFKFESHIDHIRAPVSYVPLCPKRRMRDVLKVWGKVGLLCFFFSSETDEKKSIIFRPFVSLKKERKKDMIVMLCCIYNAYKEAGLPTIRTTYFSWYL